MPSKVFLILAAAFLTITVASKQVAQKPLSSFEQESVPGDNNATFCTIPRSERLFEVEFWDIAPLPLVTNKRIFTYLRGLMPYTPGLDTAKLRFTISAELDSGEPYQMGPETTPLTTFSAMVEGLMHLTVRYNNEMVDGVPVPRFGGPLRAGYNEIVTDVVFLAMFMHSGNYTFKLEGLVPAEEDSGKEEKYLFCFQMSKWLKGDL